MQCVFWHKVFRPRVKYGNETSCDITSLSCDSLVKSMVHLKQSYLVLEILKLHTNFCNVHSNFINNPLSIQFFFINSKFSAESLASNSGFLFWICLAALEKNQKVTGQNLDWKLCGSYVLVGKLV